MAGIFAKDKDMYGNAKFKTVPIIDVTRENVASVGAVVRGAIIGADFIAIDCVRICLNFHVKIRTLKNLYCKTFHKKYFISMLNLYSIKTLISAGICICAEQVVI